MTLKEITIIGKPGNIVAIFNRSPRHNGLPTRGLAWGPIGEDGTYRALIDDVEYPEIQIEEYEPQVARHFERWWHLNTEPFE